MDNFHKDQRAWIGITVLSGGLHVGPVLLATVVANNTGRTPAQHTFLYLNTVPVLRGQKVDFSQETRVDASGVVFPGGVMKAATHNSFHAGVRQESFDAYKREDVQIAVIGKVTYDDVYKRGHWVTFCYTLDSEDLTTFNLCPYGNEVDDQ